MSIKKFFIIPGVLSLFTLSSCIVGLGQAVDLEAPVVSITAPDYMANIGKSFIAEGTVSDNVAVTKLVVSFAGHSWTWEKESWSEGTDSSAIFEKQDDGKIKWSIPLSLPENVSDNQYTITVSAYDEMNNTSSTSLQKRTVIYDTTAPVVKITEPSIEYKTYASINTSLNDENYRNLAMLSSYLNGDIEISGLQEEDYTLKNLQVWLCGNNQDEVYWDSGLLDETRRTWTITVPEDEIKLNGIKPSEKTFLQIVTQSTDAANNISAKQSHGWICYWPQADQPWIECNSISSDADSAKKIYPGSQFFGNAYDDDGIKRISTRVFKGEDFKTLVEEKNYSPAEEEMQIFYYLNITAPVESGLYKIQIEGEDVNGRKTETLSGFFKIQDISIPSVSVISPDPNEALLGDKDGEVTFQLKASDDSRVKNIKVVWLKDSSQLLNYIDGDSDLWNKVSGENPRYTDSQSGNKLWNIIPEEGTKSGTRTIHNAQLSINLFEDLNIGLEEGKNILTSQSFIFRVEDDSGKVSTLEYNCQGDNQQPEISFEKLLLKKSDGSLYSFNIDDFTSGRNKLSAIENGDQVQITGKWSDNSTRLWGKDKISSITLKWLTQEIAVTKNADGSWISKPFTPTHSSSISLKASITDFAKNTGSVTAAFTAEAEKPELLSISSSASDGSYSVGKIIPVKMKFNKPVYFTESPVLTLNNGASVSLSRHEGYTTYFFDYTVESGDDTQDLDVIAVTGFTACRDGSAANCAVNIEALNESERNLSHNKNISILTEQITLTNFKLEEDGKELKLIFNHEIRKNSGSITISQKDVDRVPAILTASQYASLLSSNPAFKEYYTKGTNGYSDQGKPDLTAKYILDYKYDADNPELLEMFKASKMNVVKIDISSSAVSIEKNVLKVDLSSAYSLPVKGADYTVSLSNLLVTDIVQGEFKSCEETISLPGVENPVIRIERAKAEFNQETLTASQPLSAGMKIDCQTPGAKITYFYKEKISLYSDNVLNLGNSKNKNYPAAEEITGSDFVLSSEEKMISYKDKVTLKSENKTYKDWQYGMKFFITAKAEKGEDSVKSYNVAAKSLFVFKDDGKVTSDFASKKMGVWLRGGDSETGSNLTAGFPLSWDAKDTDGIALLTETSLNGTIYWYYITWELPTKAYLTTLAGKVKANSFEKGPSKWYWSSNAWVPFRQFYPLYPGESRTVETGKYSEVWGQTRGSFSWSGYGSSSATPTHTPSEEVAVYNAHIGGSEILSKVIDLSANSSWNQAGPFAVPSNGSLKQGSKIAIIYEETFDEEVEMWLQLVSGYWSTKLTEQTRVSGAAISNEKILPSDSSGVIYYTLSSYEAAKLKNEGLLVCGYGLKITSIQIIM